MNKKTLSILLVQLANMTNNATNKTDAIAKGLTDYLYLDNYPMYGGYNLVKVEVNGGGHSNSFNSFPSCGGRVNASTMINKMRSFMDGLNYQAK